MTILNVTVSPAFGMLSQDSAVYRGDPEALARSCPPAGDHDGAAANAFVGDGAAPKAELLGFRSKITYLPHLHMIAGGSGSAFAYGQWAAMLVTAAGSARDIEEINELAPEGLRSVVAAIGQHFVVAHVGVRHGQVVGYAYASGDGFRPTRLPIGHSTMPALNVHDPEYIGIETMWKPAALGDNTEEFHVRLARNQHAAWRAGMFRPGVGIGGQLHVAKVDRGGIGISIPFAFPGHADQREAIGRPQLGAPLFDYDAEEPPATLKADQAT